MRARPSTWRSSTTHPRRSKTSRPIEDSAAGWGRRARRRSSPGDASTFERVEAALAGVDTSPRVFVANGSIRRSRPDTGCRTWSPLPVDRRGGDVRGAVVPHALDRRRRARARSRRACAVRLRPRPHARRGLPLELSAHLLGTPARQESKVFAVDANGTSLGPGPRVVDGVELLAHLLHPDAYPDPGCRGAGSA